MSDDGLGTLVTFNPFAVRGEETLSELAQRLQTSGFHHWPVVDSQRRLIGIISDSDVARNVAARQAAQQSLEADSGGSPSAETITTADVMSQRVFSIDINATKAGALERLIQHDIHSLPVVDGEQLVGIVTSTDLLRELSSGMLPKHRDPVSRHMSKTTESIDAGLSLDEARIEVMTAGMRYLPVTLGDCPLGVISQRMLRKAKCQQLLAEFLDDVKSAKEMTVMGLVKTAPTIKPGDRLARAAELMVNHGVQAVAVVNQGQKLLGVISEDDILHAAFAELKKEQNKSLVGAR